MSGKEVIPFSVKGPIPVQLAEPRGSTTGERAGCRTLDLHFQYPCQIGEMIFSNYYTAWISVYVKRMPSRAHPIGKDKAGGKYSRTRHQLERSVSTEVSGSGHSALLPRTESQWSEDDLDVKPLSGSVTDGGRNRRHSSSPVHLFDSAERPWELSIEAKSLMPVPHYETGSQDIISIPATESLVEWRDVILMRLVLHQPSTIWKRFSVEDLNVFRQLPKRGFSHCDHHRQRDNWFSILRKSTRAVLSGQIVEPENNTSEDELTS